MHASPKCLRVTQMRVKVPQVWAKMAQSDPKGVLNGAKVEVLDPPESTLNADRHITTPRATQQGNFSPK